MRHFSILFLLLQLAGFVMILSDLKEKRASEYCKSDLSSVKFLKQLQICN